MKLSEILETQEPAYLLRIRKEKFDSDGNIQYDVKPLFTGSKKGWVIVDAMSHSALKAVFNGLKPELRAKFDKISITRLLDLAWKHVKVGA